MLKHLQKSVEEEELVWKSKMANSEEQLNEARSHKNLRKASFIFYVIKPKRFVSRLCRKSASWKQTTKV